MVGIYQFPYNIIRKGSRVILYGAGKNGLKVFKQIIDESWCRILCVVDQNYKIITDFPVSVTSPESLRGQVDYDYILVTITSKSIARSIADSLADFEIPIEKIVLLYENSFAYLPDRIELESEEIGKGALLKICLHIMGAIGDFVMTLKVYEEIVKLAPKCIVDIWGDNQWFIDHVFFDSPNLGCNLIKHPEEPLWKEYDVILSVRFTPRLKKVNFNRVRKLAPVFAERLEEHYKHEKENSIDLHVFQYENRILLERSRLLGLNRYTLFGYSGLFEILDKKVNLQIAAWAEEQFQKIKLDKPYITFNYGAANPLQDGKPQTKQWLPEYHTELNRMLKEAFPEIEIIQLGSADVTIIDGADRYIFGVNLEVAKCILKHSLFHFDCEGGLVHIATQLGTKCFVVFGPTPIWFLGYEQNVNIAPDTCGECKGLITDWYTRCYRGYSPPACMASITPERVFGLMREFISGQNNHD